MEDQVKSNLAAEPAINKSALQEEMQKTEPVSQKKTRKALKISLFILYFLVLIGMVARLFFEEQFNSLILAFRNLRQEAAKTLVIGFSEPFIKLDPLANDSGSRSRLLNIYEGLTRVSPDLNIEPGLAISYGALDDYTWEFRLRPDVYFHDGKLLTIDDVIFSLNEARNNPVSEVRDLALTIKEIKSINEDTLHIVTYSPDPLLLSKLSYFLIFPREGAQNIGTGPYALLKNEQAALALRKFPQYWDAGNVAFSDVILKTFASKQEKIQALQNHTVDIVANVPADIAQNFDFEDFELKTIPSLEVNFLMFNFDGIFRDARLRQAVSLALKKDELAKLVHGFAVSVSQFVGNGIFGYNPEIAFVSADAKRAKTLVKEASPFDEVSVALDLPSGLTVFGDRVREQLRTVGISAEINYLAPAELSRKIVNRKSEFFFFGWKSDLGDAQDFLTAAIHSSTGTYGQFNGGNYKNPEVDELIEQSQNTIDSEGRLKKLRAVMKKITQEDIIGVPLFSPEVLYGVSKNVKWKPRVDSYVLAQEAEK